MAIIHINPREPTELPDGFEIAGKVGDLPISIKITREAVNAVKPPPGSYLKRLRENLDLFYRIANLKAERGKFETDGSILIDEGSVTDLLASALVDNHLRPLRPQPK